MVDFNLKKKLFVEMHKNNPLSERDKEEGEITPTRVTQGRRLNDNPTGYFAEHATDGFLSTKSATSPKNGETWLKIEFDKNYSIHKVVIYYMFVTNWYNPNTWCSKNEARLTTCADNHSNVDVSVYQGDVKQKSCGKLQLTNGLEQSDQIYTLLCMAEGDTVKLSKNSGVIEVCELVVVASGKFPSNEVKMCRKIQGGIIRKG